MSFIINYFIPVFKTNPTENAKQIIKLIFNKAMDPNKLKELYLKKECMEGNPSNLPDKTLDVSCVALACMKY